MKELFEIFLAFVKIGGLTFGGGYAMMPLLQREVVEKKQWATMDEIMDWYSIGQCLPGIIMVNTALFVGHKRKGIVGGVVAALGEVCPSLVVITIIASLLNAFADVPVIVNAFAGIRVCVCVLVLNAVVALWKKAVVDWKCFIIFLVVCVFTTFTDISPIIFVLVSAVLGIAIKSIGRKKDAA